MRVTTAGARQGWRLAAAAPAVAVLLAAGPAPPSADPPAADPPPPAAPRPEGPASAPAPSTPLPAEQPASGQPASDPATRRMVERLRELSHSADATSNIMLNDRRAALNRTLLDAASEEERLELRFALGYELLLAGDTEAALAELEPVLDACRESGGCPLPERELRELVAVSYLRLGEQENCILAHTADSCLLPIRATGVHRLQRGSRTAIEHYRELLAADPGNLAYRWLLNLAYMTLGEYPDGVPEEWRIPPSTFASDYQLSRFQDVAPALGVDVVALSGGVVADDFSGDGRPDLLVSSWGLEDQLRYFVLEGDGFRERTAEAGLGGVVGGLNLVQADFDNDGWLDALVLRGAWLEFFGEGHHPNSLLRNRGDGTFADVTETAGLLSFMPTQTAAWADYDGDGWLDLFIGNESYGRQRFACELYHNRGDGTFVEVAAASGVDVVGLVKGVAWGDYDNDGRPDLYVSRFAQPNLLFRNEGPAAAETAPAGAWRFREVAAEAGVTEPLKSFPVWFFDYDNDGWEDLLVASFLGLLLDSSLPALAADYLGLPSEGERPRLYRNRGDGAFEDVTARAGLDKALLVMGANYGDLDNDGFLDFYFGTGEPNLATLIPNRMFRNDGGQRFQDVTSAGGFGHLQKGHGVAFVDFDADGDQDVYTVMGGAYSGDTYQNVLFLNPGHGNRWITLRLEGVAANRSAIGARVAVTVEEAGGERTVYATVGWGGSFGASSLQQEIGLGQATALRSIEIRWPGSGTRQLFEGAALDGVSLDRAYSIREGDPAPAPLDLPPIELAPAGAETATAHHGR